MRLTCWKRCLPTLSKKLLTNASPEVRRDINHLLRYPEDSAGSIMTVEYVDLKENLTVNQAIERIRKWDLTVRPSISVMS